MGRRTCDQNICMRIAKLAYTKLASYNVIHSNEQYTFYYFKFFLVCAKMKPFRSSIKYVSFCIVVVSIYQEMHMPWQYGVTLDSADDFWISVDLRKLEILK